MMTCERRGFVLVELGLGYGYTVDRVANKKLETSEQLCTLYPK